jgi:predicted Zn-dependent protease with MMP-like domain
MQAWVMTASTASERSAGAAARPEGKAPSANRGMLPAMAEQKRDQKATSRMFDALDAAEARLDDGDLEGARAALADAITLGGEDHPAVIYTRACLVWEEQGPAEATPLLERVIAVDPAHADAHYALACAAEERGDREAMIEHHSHAHRLDARADREARLGDARQLDHIERVAHEVLSALPSPFAERLAHVPVLLERRPSRELVRDGFDPRALGLFEGPADGDTVTASPTRIVLYVNNLLAEFDPNELDTQIEITLLHEIGHFFGLDEADMERLGLD